MKKFISKAAFTLMELIIAMVLVGIVLLGIISINTVLGNNGQDYGQRYLVKSETQATLNHILNNASLAVGDGQTNNGMKDLGILSGAGGPPGVGDANSFCIHQAHNNNITGTDPGYDIWLCYTFTGAPTYQINYCSMKYTPTSTPYRGAVAPCPGGSPFLGTAFSISPSFNVNPNPDHLSNSNNQLQFSITIQNCLNDNAPTPGNCSISGTSGDPVNNPEVTVSGSVAPSQEGSG